MEKISFFLKKFKSIGLEEVYLKQACQEVIQDFFSFKINTKAIEVRDGQIFLKIPSVLRSEVFIRKAAVLKALSQKLGGGKVRNIR